MAFSVYEQVCNSLSLLFVYLCYHFFSYMIQLLSSNPNAQVKIQFPEYLQGTSSSVLNETATAAYQNIQVFDSLTLFDGSLMKVFIKVDSSADWIGKEKLRKVGAGVLASARKNKLSTIHIDAGDIPSDLLYCIIEGLVLSSYTFNRHKTEKKEEVNFSFSLCSTVVSEELCDRWIAILESVFITRDLVNEPHSVLTATELSNRFELMGSTAGFEVEVWNESKIKAQKMGGLLAVNQGSLEPPTFSILEYKPSHSINQKPIVLVGKGVVYDTGGMSLKPTPNSMDQMKCDMAGAAAVAGILYAVSKAKLPYHIIGLVPATDNRPGEEAIVPGDIITMYNGNTVEVKNTDAEGRLILADALHYARKLNPELVVDFATLTGASVRAIGPYASAIMGNVSDKMLSEFISSGYAVHERVISFPLWEDYAEELRSDVADFSNLGKGEGGHMSAGKFLEKFVDYPWLHVDIAGPAFIMSPSHYHTAGGTGVGVRFFVHFLTQYFKA